MVKVVDGIDPAELLAGEARRLATALAEFADALDRHDGVA